jgi:hypothetical protein
MDIKPSVWRKKSVTPSEALKIAELAFGNGAMTAIMDYLSGGMIIAVSERSSTFALGEDTQTFDEPMPIPEDCWQHISLPDQFWKTGHARFSIPRTVAGFTAAPRQIVCAGIRLDRGQVERHFSTPTVPDPTETVPPPQTASETKKAPSPANLRTWFEAYTKIHGDRGLHHAWTSAKAMFPDHEVVRRSVENLRGPGIKAGPKPKKD